MVMQRYVQQNQVGNLVTESDWSPSLALLAGGCA